MISYFNVCVLYKGYHQKCHDPVIPAEALEYETPWHCAFCLNGAKNPHIEENPFGLTKRKTFGKITDREQIVSHTFYVFFIFCKKFHPNHFTQKVF